MRQPRSAGFATWTILGVAAFLAVMLTHLLADAFVESQADGRVLTRAQAIEKYTRVDDVSTEEYSMMTRRRFLIGGTAGMAALGVCDGLLLAAEQFEVTKSHA